MHHIIQVDNPRRRPSYVAKIGFTENVSEAHVLSLYWAHSKCWGLSQYLHLEDRLSIRAVERPPVGGCNDYDR